MSDIYSLGNLAGALLQGYRIGASDKLARENMEFNKAMALERLGMAKESAELNKTMALEKLGMAKEQHAENIRKSKISNEVLELGLKFAKETDDLKRKLLEEKAKSAQLSNLKLEDSIKELEYKMDRTYLNDFTKDLVFALQNYVNGVKKFGTKETGQFDMILKNYPDIVNYLTFSDADGSQVAGIVPPEKLSDDEIKELIDSEDIKLFEQTSGVKFIENIKKEDGKTKIKFNPLFLVIKKTNGNLMPVFVPTLFGIVGYDPDAETLKNLKELLNVKKVEAEIEGKKAQAKKYIADANKKKGDEDKILVEAVKGIKDIYKTAITAKEPKESAVEFLGSVKTAKEELSRNKGEKNEIPNKTIEMPKQSNIDSKMIKKNILDKASKFLKPSNNAPKPNK